MINRRETICKAYLAQRLRWEENGMITATKQIVNWLQESSDLLRALLPSLTSKKSTDFHAGFRCSGRCRCIGCKNVYGERKENVDTKSETIIITRDDLNRPYNIPSPSEYLNPDMMNIGASTSQFSTVDHVDTFDELMNIGTHQDMNAGTSNSEMNLPHDIPLSENVDDMELPSDIDQILMDYSIPEDYN
ncbi:hypothetical protein LXL04_005293 [Taraxacum kok-saghyz]